MSRKVVVLGLDGVPRGLLEKYVEKGYLPNIGNILKTGYFDSLGIPLPEVSSVSWSSFMTGANPGEHNIFGFMDFRPKSYDLYFPQFNDLKKKTIFDEVGDFGMKSVVINLPSTYPARKFPGILISGFVAPYIEKAVWPSYLVKDLKDFGYRIDVDAAQGAKDYEYLFKDLNECLDVRVEVAKGFWERKEWDLFMLVFTGTDRLHHFLFDVFDDENSKYYSQFVDYYKRLDGYVGELYERYLGIEEDKLFVMLSDHGFAKSKADFYLNYWLYENGYLNYSKDSPDFITDIGSETKAFSLDPSRIYINLEDKYPLGIVRESEYEGLCDELRDKLLSLEYRGEKVIEKVFSKEEIYSGEYIQNAPDLVVLAKTGFQCRARVNVDAVFDKSFQNGTHDFKNAFIYNSRNIEMKNITGIKGGIIDFIRGN